MKIQRKLRMLALIAAVLMVSGLIVTISGLRAIQAAADQANSKQVEIQGVTEIKASALSSIELDPASADTRKIFSDAEQNIGKWAPRLSALMVDPAEAESLRALLAEWADYDRHSQQLITLAAHDAKSANDQVTALYHAGFQPFQAHLEQLITQLEQETESTRVSANQTSQQVFWTVCAVLSLTLCALLGVIWSLAHTLNLSLSGIRDSMRQVVETRDFTLRVPILKQDEIGETANSFNQLLDVLQQNLRTLQQGAGSVANASLQMRESSKRISQAVSTQSEASSSAAAAVEQVTVSVNHVAERTNEVKTQSQEGSRLAAAGSETIERTIADIREISASVSSASSAISRLDVQSSGIVSVVQVIRDVADQTNLLALNAAIEAARAGETGRGFAVVADEVRKLAERTAASTREIGANLESMNLASRQAVDEMQKAAKLVSAGVERADQADRSIHLIGESVTSAAVSVADIASAISEQGSASNGIAQQIERIAHMAEQASAAALSADQGAQDLYALAQQQMDILAQYCLG